MYRYKAAMNNFLVGGELEEREQYPDEIKLDDVFTVIDLYFKQKNIMYSHQHNSFDKFLDDDVHDLLKNSDNIFFEKITKDKVYRYKFKFDDVAIKPPMIDAEDEMMFPQQARIRDMTYAAKLVATVTQIQEIVDIATDEVTVKQIGEPEYEYPIATIPIMVRSKYCSLNLKKGHDKSECDHDPGGYFIVGGSEKVVMTLERMIENKPLVFTKKDTNMVIYTAQINSKAPTNDMIQIVNLRMKKDSSIVVKMPILNEVPVFVLMRALGVESDREIINYTVYDTTDVDMINVVRISLDNCATELGYKIMTQEDALSYLITKMRVVKRYQYTETDKDQRILEKKMHLISLLQNSFLPHVNGDLIDKAYFLGYMLNRLLQCFLKRIPVDDRDSFVNKRLDLPGALMFDLFKQSYKKMLNECSKFFRKRNNDDDKPQVIINQIKPNIIEQGLKTALSTGAWGKKKGVAQMLMRLTYMQMLSALRRLNSPTFDASTNKMTGPRHLHGTQIGSVCVTKDTEVLLADGKTFKTIGLLTESDSVLTVNDQLKEEPSSITNLFMKRPKRLLKIETEYGKTLKCTPEHPLLTLDAYKAAEELKVNDKVVVLIERVTDEYSTCFTVYDIVDAYLLMNEIADLGFMSPKPFMHKINQHCYKVYCDKDFNRNMFCVDTVKSVIDVNKEDIEAVYDFTTVSDNHNFIANSFVTHNCYVETPEGHKVGLVKNLSMMGNVTISIPSQHPLIKGLIIDKVINVSDVPSYKIKDYTKVFFNGEWLGLTDKPEELYSFLKEKKLNNEIDSHTSINHEIKSEIENKELKVYCDGGRLFRPIFRVEKGKLLLSKDHVDNISLDNFDSATKVTTWNEFMMKNPGVIEYLDTDEQFNSMIAMFPADIKLMRDRKNTKIPFNTSSVTNVINRYGDLTYVEHTHCEIHPSMHIGAVVANIPFSNCNQAPRNIFQYSQAKHAMGIYASNYRDRADISHILYNSQRPLVNTRLMKYVGTDMLPSGENAVVAIACYTGFNQEDSVIMNRSSVERGLFRSTSLKKFKTTIQKNQSTSQDDVFIKPDPDVVAGRRPGSYDKLNNQGYAPEETEIVTGDIIIGKVSPIQAVGNSKKLFKDNSEPYKEKISGVIDKVWTNIYNNEGYEIRKVRTRSERTPVIGDKFCCYSPNHEVLTSKGWKKIDEITQKDLVACLFNGNIMKYCNPTAIQEYGYDGKMYSVETNQVSLLVTPNHRMYVGNRHGQNYKIEYAEDIYGKRRKYLKNVENIEIDQTNIPKELEIDEHNNVTKFKIFGNNDVVKHTFDIEPWLSLFGIWMAEGSIGQRSVSFAAHKQRVKDELVKCCMQLGLNIGKWKDNDIYDTKHIYCICSTAISEYFKQFGTSINKFLPDWVWFLSKKQSKILINGMMLGDGHSMKDTTTRRYDTSSKKLRDDFQRLCLHAGYSANWYTRTVKTRNDIKLDIPEIITTTTESYRLTVVEKQNKPLVNKNMKLTGEKQLDKWIDYTGNVHCVTVPGDGVIYVRRNGKPVWCGNSRHGQKGTVGILLPQYDMPFTKNGVSPDIIVNPNAIPSRMTIGQLIECLVGKVSAIRGHETDGTPFRIWDIEKVKDVLESLGYERNGYEDLYNGMTGCKMKTAIFIGPTYYQRLKHMVNDKIHCLSMDHDVLTANGWKSYSQLTMDDEIATLKDDKLVYEKPIELLYYPDYKGKMYHIKNQLVDLNVTTNHRMYVKRLDQTDFKLVVAEDVVNQDVVYKKDAECILSDYQFTLFNNHINSDAWLTFIGIWMANSCTDPLRSGNQIIVHCNTDPVMYILSDVVQKLGYTYNINDNDEMTIQNTDLYNYLSQLNNSVFTRRLPDWVSKLSKTQSKLLIKSMMLDFYDEIAIQYPELYKSRYYELLNFNNDMIFYTLSPDLADDVMRLCLHAGLSCYIVDKDFKTDDNWIRLKIYNEIKYVENQIDEVIDFEGPVFCLQVPSEIFYVRRNGKPVWTGNSRARGPRTILTRQPPEGRSREGGLRFGEMERDTIISHGMARFLKERMMETADAYSTHICEDCGLFAQRILRKDNKPYATSRDVYFCPSCRNNNRIAQIRIPYAFKLLVQEMMAMNIAPRIRVKQSQFD